MSSSPAEHHHPEDPSHEILETEPAAASGPLAGDPSTLGLIMFVPGGVSLGLALTSYTTGVPATGSTCSSS